MDAIEAIRTRRSIRSYLTRPVERNLIEQIIYGMLRKLHHRGAARFLGHSMSSRASTGFPPTGIGQNNTQKTITRTSQAGNGRKYPTFRCSGAHRS